MARVNVNITARDLTGNDMRRIRASFRRLGQDMDRMGTQRTRQNFDRLGQSVSDARRQLNAMRGSIPDDEFFRMDDAIRRASRTMNRGFNGVGQRAMTRVQQDVRNVVQSFDDLDRRGAIRVRVDTSALQRADRLLRQGLTQRARVPVRLDGRHVRRDTDSIGRRIRTGLMSPLRAMGGAVSGVLSDGVGQGIISGAIMGGRIGGTLFVGAILAAVSMLGAALSGILVTALGAAFVGVGVVSAAMSKKVKDHWSDTLGLLKEKFAEAGKPFIPVLDDALDRMDRMIKTFAPGFQKEMEKAVPATDKFIQSLQDGFIRFGQNAFDPIMDAWNVFGPVFASEWEDFMGELGDSFKEMANLVKEHPEEIRIALRGVLETIDLIVDAITFFGEVWVFTLQHAGDVLGDFIMALKGMFEISVGAFDALIEGGSIFLSMIPGMSTQADKAKEAWNDFKEGATQAFEDAANSAYNMGKGIDQANRKRRLEADISMWQAQMTRARADMKKTTDAKAKAKLKADISDLNAKIAAARAKLNSLNGKTATTYVNTVYTKQTINYGETIGQPTSRARGGIIGAATGGIRSNLTMVGEHGPELVTLPPGAHVRSNPDTRRMLGAGGGDGGTYQINLVVDGKTLAEVLFDPTRKIVRNKGGLARAYGE